MVEENFNSNDIDCLPLGIAILREGLRACKYDPPTNWPNVYLLIGREDLINKGLTTTTKDIFQDKIQEIKEEHKNYSELSNITHSSSKTFMDKDRYKYEKGKNIKNNRVSSYSRRKYEIKKLLQKIGAPKPKLHAVNDINAIHKSCENVKSATKTLKVYSV